MSAAQWSAEAAKLSFLVEELEGTLPANFDFRSAEMMVRSSREQLMALAEAVLEHGASSEGDCAGAVAVVVELLKDEDWRVRGVIASMFADVLDVRRVEAAEIHSVEVESALRALGGDPYMSVKLSAAMTLRYSHQYANVLVLARIVQDALQSGRFSAMYTACGFVEARHEVLSGCAPLIGRAIMKVSGERLARQMLEALAAIGTDESRRAIVSVAASHRESGVRELARGLLSSTRGR
jgi:hypothetical protein